MAVLFDAKLRRIGNSVGVIIPNKIIEAEGYRQGETIHVSLPAKGLAARNATLREMAGACKGKGGFQREEGDRY